MDRDDYRDKLLDSNVRKRELQQNIEQSTAQDMIDRQVNGGIDQSSLTRTLVDGRADDASSVTQKNITFDNVHLKGKEKGIIKNVVDINTTNCSYKYLYELDNDLEFDNG